MMKILYEDNHLIAIYKQSGVLVQGDSTGDPTLMDEVKYYLKQKYHKTGKVFLGLLHRLDRNVQGIILFAKTSKGASRLSEQFRNHTVEKIYHAVVEGRPQKDKDTLVHWLSKDEKVNRVVVEIARPLPALPSAEERGHHPSSPSQRGGNEERSGWQRAELSYEVVRSNGKYSLLKIKLGTGRSHQIRAQLSVIGCPIVGDIKYGAPVVLKNNELALAATTLTFVTATEPHEVTVHIPLPESWSQFI